MTLVHEVVAFLLACVLFSLQLVIAGYLGVHIVQAVEQGRRRR
jgi:hypothetical protein